MTNIRECTAVRATRHAGSIGQEQDALRKKGALGQRITLRISARLCSLASSPSAVRQLSVRTASLCNVAGSDHLPLMPCRVSPLPSWPARRHAGRPTGQLLILDVASQVISYRSYHTYWISILAFALYSQMGHYRQVSNIRPPGLRFDRGGRPSILSQGGLDSIWLAELADLRRADAAAATPLTHAGRRRFRSARRAPYSWSGPQAASRQ